MKTQQLILTRCLLNDINMKTNYTTEPKIGETMT